MQNNHWGKPSGAFRRRDNLGKARDEHRAPVAAEQAIHQSEECSRHMIYCLQQDNAQLLWKLGLCKERLHREEKSVKVLKDSNAELRSSIQQRRADINALRRQLEAQRQSQELRQRNQELQQQSQLLKAALKEIDGHQMEWLMVRSQMMHVEVTARDWQEEKQQVHCSTQELQGLFKELLCKLKPLKGASSTTRQQDHEAVGNCGLGGEEKSVEAGKQADHNELLADSTQSLQERMAALESELADCRKMIAYQREALAFYPPMPPFAVRAWKTPPPPAAEPILQTQLQGLVGIVRGMLEELQDPISSDDQQDQQAVGQDGGVGGTAEVTIDDITSDVELRQDCDGAIEGVTEVTIDDITSDVELRQDCGGAIEGVTEVTIDDITSDVELRQDCGGAIEGVTEGEQLELHEPSAADATVEVVVSTPHKANAAAALLGPGKNLFGALRVGKLAKGTRQVANRLLRVGKQK